VRASKDKLTIVIVGGGVEGLSLAYNLARLGQHKIIVFEKNYVGSGASSRNATAVRDAWFIPELCNLMRETVKVWQQLSSELDYNVLFSRRGYFFVARTDSQLELCEEAVRLQKTCGIETRLLDNEEAVRLVPCLNAKEVAGGIFSPKAGIARHEALIYGYMNACLRLGVSIVPHTNVEAIRVGNGCVKSVKTDRGEVETQVVVNAAGGDSKEVAKMVGVEIPTHPTRWEALVTEPIKPYFDPYIRCLKTGLYMNQTIRGEIVAGIDSAESPSVELRSSLSFLKKISKTILPLIPPLSRLSVLRAWAGTIAVTPDDCPILGPVPEVEGFILDCGWLFGFAAAPIAGRMLAKAIVEDKVPGLIEPFRVTRFAEGKLLGERKCEEKMVLAV